MERVVYEEINTKENHLATPTPTRCALLTQLKIYSCELIGPSKKTLVILVLSQNY